MQTTTTTNNNNTLGRQVASYGPRRRRWREAWVWPIPGYILSIILLITGFDWYHYGYTQYGPVAATFWSQNWLIWGFLIGILTLASTIVLILRSRVRVDIYRYGVEIKLPVRLTHQLRWDKITGISSSTTHEQFLKHTYRSTHRIVITRSNGNPLILDDRISNLVELATRLKANLYPRLLPGLRVQYQNGHPINFGPIEIQKEYLSFKNTKIPWARIRRITVLSGHLVIETFQSKPKQWKSMRVSIQQIPNLELLFQVLDRGSIEQL